MKKSQDEILKLLNIPEVKTFESFELIKGTKPVVDAFKNMAEGKGKPLLLCVGGYGNGKTHLLQAMILRLYERNIICVYRTFEEILSLIKRGMRKDTAYDAEYVMNIICRRPWLAIDDFGLGSETSWAEGRLDVIIDYRYRYGLPTILVTNKEFSELPQRVESRFQDPERSVVVVNEGKDYRRRKI